MDSYMLVALEEATVSASSCELSGLASAISSYSYSHLYTLTSRTIL